MTDDLVVKAKCEACQAAGIVALAIAPEYVLQLLSKIERLQSSLSVTEARWRQVAQDKSFRQRYREIIEQCADELRELLTSFDDREIQAEIYEAARGPGYEDDLDSGFPDYDAEVGDWTDDWTEGIPD